MDLRSRWQENVKERCLDPGLRLERFYRALPLSPASASHIPPITADTVLKSQHFRWHDKIFEQASQSTHTTAAHLPPSPKSHQHPKQSYEKTQPGQPNSGKSPRSWQDLARDFGADLGWHFEDLAWINDIGISDLCLVGFVDINIVETVAGQTPRNAPE